MYWRTWPLNPKRSGVDPTCCRVPVRRLRGVPYSELARSGRTPPLWKLSERTRFLHDGRSFNLQDAIRSHGGQGQAAADAFSKLDSASKQALLDFLGCI